jgi:nucleotide-binding universal stress UspA family protein
MFETLIVPLDGSEFAAKALPTAVAIARAGHAGVRLVGIARDDDELASVRRHVNATARRVAATKGLEVDVIVDPDPTGALLELAADCTSVLCFASHDYRSVATRLIHSVGSALVARAACPIVVVGEHAAQAARATDVVVAVDGVGDPQPLLATATSWARQLGAPLRIVTVFEPAPADLDQPGHFTRHHGPPVDPDVYLGAIERGADGHGLASVSTASIPDPVGVTDGIVDHLASRPAGLLVVGGGRPKGLRAGTVRELLRTVSVPLVVVNRQDR